MNSKKELRQAKIEKNKSLQAVVKKFYVKRDVRRFLKLLSDSEIKRFNHLFFSRKVEEYLKISTSDDVKSFLEQLSQISEEKQNDAE